MKNFDILECIFLESDYDLCDFEVVNDWIVKKYNHEIIEVINIISENIIFIIKNDLLYFRYVPNYKDIAQIAIKNFGKNKNHFHKDSYMSGYQNGVTDFIMQK